MSSNFKISSCMFKESKSTDLCFVIFNGSLLINKKDAALEIPRLGEINKLGIEYENIFFLGEINGQPCFGIEAAFDFDVAEDYELMPLYEVGMLMDEEFFLAMGRANQILNWERTHKFCGQCGSKTKTKQDELAKVCTNCNHVMYPVICPAIIVAITKGDQILLAHNKGFRNNMYSLIAGFVEAGEDLESAVKREVFEEVGITVKNIKYFKSSPWSFPNSLMLGFFAEYEEGEIKVDGKEIVHADWFTKDNFPSIPNKHTVARKIIDEFVKRNK